MKYLQTNFSHITTSQPHHLNSIPNYYYLLLNNNTIPLKQQHNTATMPLSETDLQTLSSKAVAAKETAYCQSRPPYPSTTTTTTIYPNKIDYIHT